MNISLLANLSLLYLYLSLYLNLYLYLYLSLYLYLYACRPSLTPVSSPNAYSSPLALQMSPAQDHPRMASL